MSLFLLCLFQTPKKIVRNELFLLFDAGLLQDHKGCVVWCGVVLDLSQFDQEEGRGTHVISSPENIFSFEAIFRGIGKSVEKYKLSEEFFDNAAIIPFQ